VPQLATATARRSSSTLALAVFVGGCAGAVARAGLASVLPTREGAWPWATFTANIVGTALLAFVVTRLQERLPPSTYRRPLVGTGFCGALTTFSTLQIEIIRLGRDGHERLAGAYLAASLVAGLLTMLAVSKLVRRARPR
jgi:CrcB protein